MKTYHIRFTQDDFVSKTTKTVDATTTRYIWRTPVYNLYDNPQYKNYSVKRSNYGTDLLGNGVYTGLNRISPTVSDIGYVSGGRFIDTSGRIDIIDWKATFDTAIELGVASKISIFTTEFSDATPVYIQPTASDWATQENILSGRSIFNIDTYQYAYFELSFDLDSAIVVAGKSVEMIVSIAIDPPVIDGYFPATRQLQNKFPEWMSLREYDASDPTGATPATPSSIGGSFLNAVAGEWLTDLTAKIKYQEFQFHIDTVDMDQRAWTYIAEGIPDLIWSITGDGVQLARTSNLEEFYLSKDDDQAFLWNRTTREIFVNTLYTDLMINGVKYYQKPYQVWNSLDDIGVSVDLFRIQSATPTGYLEDNDSFKKRIFDVYKNRPGVNKAAFQKALRRELNLWRYYGSTPNSDFLGATPEAFEMSDLESDPNYFVDGMPTQKFKDLVQELSVKYPMTWGFFEYGKAFWDSDGILGHQGFSTLPRQLDATPVSEQYLESGVGDGNDLFVFKPKENTNPVDFNTTIKIRGRQKTTRTEYIPLTFQAKVYAVAAEDLWANPKFDGNYTIELTVIDNSATPASPSQNVYYCNTTVSATNDTDYFHATPTNSARSFIEWTTADGYTDIAFSFKDKITGIPFAGLQIPLSMVTQVVIKPGHYNGNYATPAYTNAPTQSDYKIWFDGEPSTILGLGGSTSLTKAPYSYQTHFGSFWVESQKTLHSGATPNTWRSEEYLYTITLNGLQSNMAIKNYTLTLPSFVFPASTSSRSIILEIITQNGSTNYGAFSDATASTPIFIPSTYIAVDGNNTWTSNYKKTFSTSTTSITFSTTTGTSYPVSSSVWSLYEKSITTPISGRVDLNGPWRYNTAPAFGNTNYLLSSLSLTRDSFGIPNTSNYILTWIGVERVSNEDVISWFETNTIKPAVTDPGEVNTNFTYPDDAVVETLNITTGKYEFSSLNLFARLKPGVNQKWNPKIHSGWFYDDVEDFYLYASPNRESATGSYKVLPGLNRQGAPILINGMSNSSSTPIFSMRQTMSWDSTPTLSLTSTQKETHIGNGLNYFLVGYKDIYSIAITNLTTGAVITPTSTTSSTNKISISGTTNPNYTYEISYKVAKSFYVDNNYIDSDNINKTKVFFDKPPSQYGVDKFSIDYETSIYDPATPIDIPLNPLYTSIEEGFIYIDHDVHDLNQVEISISPTKIVADGYDYAMVVIKSYDIYGNPKPYQNFNLFTNFGILENINVTTDKDGFAYTTLSSTNWLPSTPAYPATPALPAATPGSSTQGLILVDGGVDARLGFEIQVPLQGKNRIVAVLDSDYILANGSSATYILGRVETPSFVGVPYAYVYWRKSRNLYDLFSHTSWSTSAATPGSSGISGRVVCDANGRFSIGPFVSATEAGYWLSSVESSEYKPAEAILDDAVLWIDAANSVANEQTVVNKGTGGSALNASYGSTTGVDTNDPQLLTHTGENYAYLTGANGNYLSVPAAAALDITGDFELVVRASLPDWSPSSSKALVGKFTQPGNQRSYLLTVEIGATLALYTSVDGTAVLTHSSSSIPFTDGTTYWIKATMDVNNGSGSRVARFFYAADQTDEPISWIEIGTGFTAAGTTSVFASTALAEIGSYSAGISGLTEGRFYRAIIRNGIAGSTVLDINCVTNITSSDATTFTATTGQTVTVNRSTSGKKTALVTRPVWLFGTDDRLEIADNALLDFGASDSFTLVIAARMWGASSNLVWIAKKVSTSTANVGWELANGFAGTDLTFKISDGTTSISATRSGRVSGTLSVVTAIRSATADAISNQISGGVTTSTADTTNNTLANAQPVTIGSYSAGGTNADMELHSVAIFRRALTTSEIATIVNYYNNINDSYELVGDVVYWYEYPNVTNSIDPITQLPVTSIQSATPYWQIPTYTYGSAFPTTYDETHPEAGYNNSVVNWTPPSWYAIDRYKQYQMGIYGSQYNYAGATPIYPEYKEL